VTHSNSLTCFGRCDTILEFQDEPLSEERSTQKRAETRGVSLFPMRSLLLFCCDMLKKSFVRAVYHVFCDSSTLVDEKMAKI
jgi:hypothetical protein